MTDMSQIEKPHVFSTYTHQIQELVAAEVRVVDEVWKYSWCSVNFLPRIEEKWCNSDWPSYVTRIIFFIWGSVLLGYFFKALTANGIWLFEPLRWLWIINYSELGILKNTGLGRTSTDHYSGDRMTNREQAFFLFSFFFDIDFRARM